MKSTIMIASDNTDELSAIAEVLNGSQYFEMVDTYEMKKYVHFVLEHKQVWEIYDLGLLVQAKKLVNKYAPRKTI